MANTDAPFGFQPYGNVLRQRLYAVKTAPTIGVYHNDLVKHGAVSLVTKHGPLVIIEDGAIPDGEPNILGAVLAIFDENMDPVLRIVPAEAGDGTVAGYVMVADHPDQEFVVQEDAEGNAITLTEMGNNVDMISVALCAGNAYTGRSTQELDSDSAAGGAALQCKLHFAHPNDTPASDHCRYVVTINEHHFGDNLAGL